MGGSAGWYLGAREGRVGGCDEVPGVVGVQGSRFLHTKIIKRLTLVRVRVWGGDRGAGLVAFYLFISPFGLTNLVSPGSVNASESEVDLGAREGGVGGGDGVIDADRDADGACGSGFRV